MARNDQVTRQWLLLKRLEGTRGATLQELAESLTEDFACHPRTIRRDLQALETCFPLIAERVNGHTRWRLLGGCSSVPALAFSPTELMALLFTHELSKPLEGTVIEASLDSALSKAAAALPPEGMHYVKQMQRFFSVGLGPHRSYREHRETIDQLTRSIERNRTIQMRYYSASRDRTTLRKVDPYRLRYVAGALYVIGYCHLRQDVRMFAVDRIRALTITNLPCQMPLGFDLDAYVRDALVVMRGRPAEVELLFDRRTTAWVKGDTWHESQRITLLKDGRLRMKLKVADTPELVGWILHFGGGVKVIRPDSLRDKVREEARTIAGQE